MSRRAVALLCLYQAEQLASLWGWPPARNLVDTAVDFARGEGGLTAREAQRITTWTRRWALVHPRVREFYERHSDAPEVSAALWAILAQYPKPSGPQMGRLYALWESQHGARPGFDLVPTIP